MKMGAGGSVAGRYVKGTDGSVHFALRATGQSHPSPLRPFSREWQLQFDVDHQPWLTRMAHRVGRTVLLTNRLDWTAEQLVAAYAGQQRIEQVFRGLNDGGWLGWGPTHHWADSKIRIHAFYCMLGVSLLQFLHRKSQTAWPGFSVEHLLAQLDQIKQFVLFYPAQGQKGPPRTATVLSNQTLAQQGLADALGLDNLSSVVRGQSSALCRNTLHAATYSRRPAHRSELPLRAGSASAP